jgi:hypothetical protein
MEEHSMFYHKGEIFMDERFDQKPKSFGVVSACLSLAFLMSACTQGILGGSPVKTFTGIDSATITSPTTVQISWTTNSNCTSYQVIEYTNATATVLQVASSPPIVLNSATPILSNRPYTFGVGCVQSSGVTGQGSELTVTTWAKFNNIVTAAIDTTGLNPLVNLSWSYGSGTAIFDVYAKISTVPGDLASWSLTPNSFGGYVETPICETGNSSLKMGVGGDCTPALTAGSIYNFKVVAKYPDGSESVDTLGAGTSILFPSTFTPPNCVLTQAGLGPDVADSYLYLRCGSGSAAPGSCAIANTSVRAYQAINGVNTPISDTLTGVGTLSMQPQIAANVPLDRQVVGLQLQYTCTSGSTTSTSTVRYDGTGGNLPPVLKYGNTGYEGAPIQSIQQAPSSIGQSIAIGDFDCDGKPDLAVGMPLVTYNTSPYNSTGAETGVVKIYYGYAKAADGTITSSNIQYLSFRDLLPYSHFGASLSSGNLNRDFSYDSNGNAYSCDDLIIGAPGTSNTNGGTGNYQGEAFIFYGSPNQFSQPLYRTGLATNTATCSGTATNSVCNPVRLVPDLTTYFHTDPTYTANQPFRELNGTNESQFGFTVAYVGDHNADGYGDVAIGDPYADWDGEDVNGGGISYSQLNKLQNVGAVYLYFGGSGGLQNTSVGHFSDPASTTVSIVSPFVKIYPPIPEMNMHFGYSISGGGDVDGALPVPVKQNGTNNIILAAGSDFVVGAPDFQYTPTQSDNYLLDGGVVNPIAAWALTNADTADTNLTNNTASTVVVTPKSVAPLNGAWATVAQWSGVTTMPTPANPALRASTGIAFLYRGRHSFYNYPVTINTASAQNFTRFPVSVQEPLPLGPTQFEPLLSESSQDRETGSLYLTYPGTPTNLESPVDSFYNCSNRGAPRSAAGNGYRHYSCLAGRDNYAVIYPQLQYTDTPVSQFGLSVAIAGAKEVNAVALYQQNLAGALHTGSRYTIAADGVTLNPLSSGYSGGGGGTDDSIRGTSLWELGVNGLNSGIGGDTSAAGTQQYTTAANFQQATAGGTTYPLARSPLRESFTFPASGDLSSTPDAIPTTDINRDGYADVVIGTGVNAGASSLYTYFGNYAADFSYADSLASTTAPYGFAGNCNITRTVPSNMDNTHPFVSAIPTLANVRAYSTYYARYAAGSTTGTPDHFVKGEFPVFPVGSMVLSRWLDDTTDAGGTLNLNYVAVNRAGGQTADAISRCLPQRKNYIDLITTLAAADLNGDGIVDVVVGTPGSNSSQGKSFVSFGSSTGSGLVTDIGFNLGSASAHTGTALGVSNWKFIDDSARRDLWVGSPGYSNNGVPGAGALANYNASGSTTLSAASESNYYDSVNTPNNLSANRSKVIGDVNGDGYEDILVPVKRYGPGGSVYFDGIIYFGSMFGPITTEYCQNHLSAITNSSGSTAVASDCQAAVTNTTATIASTQIHLPQYISQPLNTDSEWILGAESAGDIDHDGNDDVIVVESHAEQTYGVTSRQGAYAFYGSSSGLVVGQPQYGPSNNHSPQLIGQKGEFANSSGSTSQYSGTANVTFSAVPFTHGDFNGDGYQDIVIGIPRLSSPALTGTWMCSGATLYSTSYAALCGNGTPTSAGSLNSGGVLIVYGGPNGLQTPVNTATGAGQNYDAFTSTCNSFLQNCVADGVNTASVYGSLAIDPGTSNVTIDSTKTACLPQSSTNFPSVCAKATLVRNPMFVNATDSFTLFWNMYFGAAITAADINGDGVDDLIVGNSAFSNTSFTESGGSATYGTDLLQAGDDPARKGSVFIYYGAKNLGLVAPVAKSYLGNAGLGLNPLSSANPATQANTTAFTLYPRISDVSGQYFGKLDPAEANRGFGTSVSAGDFNGDGIDDIAVSSLNGQVYVIYGPACQYDNSSQAALLGYQFQNTAQTLGALGTSCEVMALNAPTSSGGGLYSAGPLVQTTHKTLNFQSTYINATITAAMQFGNTLQSRRPVRSPAGVYIRNPGNIDGDADKTSDLIVGSAVVSDPNVNLTNGKISGLGYLFFGHPNAGGSITTQPGLYIGTPNYNSSIVSTTVGGNVYYYYSPMILKPHTADGNTEYFFNYATEIGDLNGDGRGDIIMNSQDVQNATDGSSTVSGGGFKLFY